MNIKITTDYLLLNDISTEYNFKDSHYFPDGSYSFVCNIELSKKETKVAFISITLFNMETIEDAECDIIDIADQYDSDTYTAIFNLVQSGIADDVGDNNVFKRPFIAYIKRFYIEPDFRKKGIGSWILLNLQDILLYSLNIDIRAFVTLPSPETPNANYTCWEDDSHKPKYEELKLALIKMLMKNGFADIGDSCFGVNVMI